MNLARAVGPAIATPSYAGSCFVRRCSSCPAARCGLCCRSSRAAGSGGYGVLLAAVGAGAVAGALLLPRMRARWSLNRLLLVASALFAAVLAVLGSSRSEAVVVVALVPAGAAWVMVLSSVNAAMQLFMPNWVRARGLAVHQMVFAGAQAAGALAWGVLSDVVV